jgi:hypothetical protein
VRAIAEWLSSTPPSVAIQSTAWFIRLLQAIHLLTAGVAAVSGVMIALRVIGVQRVDQPFGVVWERFAPWLGSSLVVMAVTGLAQTLGDPVRELTATSYWVKLALVSSCVLGTLWLARAECRTSTPARFSLDAKIVAAVLVLFWLAIAMLGRMIAYDQAFWGDLSLRV